ncbi:tRNA (guanine-N(7)-)-methyltransferase [Variibacter gotjawalensis]|uniref:tRNA (guanine-N(7)-)-methyltransferase n=1 Tax=Variibacter gotjawalensis TaxID=1333996 RepID=A0A0S3PQ20_9BRAD|nr:tRNA (guanosine(46)-N7)-methyltransferase TrmB [Variibacter gotjawalensis]NIK48342.1 tRNA (guanine-N7-)-methyltransferase [Variibacter gotjawalensis]RZS50212.1 tRNA (guanine-N7-)-methyltransferase [Variibacter gotjawalensis]BAT58043.1 tRNA (guanine-N(7)-)-methyltransferase [Variibacter gotjawalensis]
MTEKNEKPREIYRGAFFGRRVGKALRSHHTSLLETLLPRVAVDLAAAAPSDLASLFAKPVREVGLEIGFGGAEHLLAQAAQNPDVGYIGAEGFINGVAKALSGIETTQTQNIRLYHGDATTLLPWLPAASLRRVDLLYPDPWPKKRHHKRRFVNAKHLGEIARVLAPGGVFHFASDIDDYVAWTLERVAQQPAFSWTAEKADDWRLPWPGYVQTRYEAKAHREGRKSCYLRFRRS